MSLVDRSSDASELRYQALVDVASALASYSELPDLFLSLRAHLEPFLEFTFLAVTLRDHGTDRLVLRFFEPDDLGASRLVGTAYPMDGTYPGAAIRTARPVYVPRVRADGPYPSQVLVEHGVESYCAVPLTTARGTLGSLNFGSLVPEAYSPEDIDSMSRVAKLVAVAVENAMSLEAVREHRAALQRERDQLDLLLEVTNAVVTQLDSRALFRAVAPALRRCCSADVAALTLFDPETHTLRKHVCDGGDCESPQPRPVTEHSLDGSPSGLVFRTATPRIFSRRELVYFPETRAFLDDHGIHSLCSVPLATPRGVIGTLDLAAFAEDAFLPISSDCSRASPGKLPSR